MEINIEQQNELEDYKHYSCHYTGCRKIADGCTHIMLDGFLVTIYNCKEHGDQAYNLIDQLIRSDIDTKGRNE